MFSISRQNRLINYFTRGFTTSIKVYGKTYKICFENAIKSYSYCKNCTKGLNTDSNQQIGPPSSKKRKCKFIDKRIHAQSKTMFYIVRHGQTDLNGKKRIQGHTDIPLNNKGKSEAANMAETFKKISFSNVFSSDRQRAYETALILVNKRSMAVRMDKRLRERNFGQWEGRLSSEFYETSKSDAKDVESDEKMHDRVFQFLNETVEQYKGKKVLIVTHGEIIRNIVVQALALSCSIKEIEIKNTCVVRLIYADGHWYVHDLEGIKLPS